MPEELLGQGNQSIVNEAVVRDRARSVEPKLARRGRARKSGPDTGKVALEPGAQILGVEELEWLGILHFVDRKAQVPAVVDQPEMLSPRASGAPSTRWLRSKLWIVNPGQQPR